MENKEDVINSPSFETLKSYTVFRRRAPPIHNSADIILAQTSVIRNWHFKLVSSSSSHYWFVLYGTVNNSFIKSSLVTDVIEDVVRTENSFYRLSGKMSSKCDPHRHFDRKLLNQFQRGFPSNWRDLLENEIKRIAEVESNLSGKSDVDVAEKEAPESGDADPSNIGESGQDNADVKCSAQQDDDKQKVSREDSDESEEVEPSKTADNVSKTRLSIEKELIAQKTAEMLSSDDECAPLPCEGPHSDLKNDSEGHEKKRTVKDFVLKLKKSEEKNGEEINETVGDLSVAGTESSNKAESEEKPPEVVVKKRVSFNTEDIQEIILDRTDSRNAAENDAPAASEDQNTIPKSEESKVVVIHEGASRVSQIRVAIPSPGRGKAKSLDVVDKPDATKNEKSEKKSDDRKSSARKKRRRLTMPSSFKS